MPEREGFTPGVEHSPAEDAIEAEAASKAAPALEGREKSFLTPEAKLFDEKNYTLLLNLDKQAVDVSEIQVSAAQHGLDQKDEFHVTVLGFKHGGEIKKALKKLPAEERQHVLGQVQALVDASDWNFSLEPERYHLAKDYRTPDPNQKGAEVTEHRESYIQMVDVPSMKTFYESLNRILGTSLEAPPAHITLYAGGNNPKTASLGIGVNSQAELAQLHPTPLVPVKPY